MPEDPRYFIDPEVIRRFLEGTAKSRESLGRTLADLPPPPGSTGLMRYGSWTDPIRRTQEVVRTSAAFGTPAISAIPGAGLIGMLAALLSAGGSADPNVAKFQEQKFQDWYRGWAGRMGLSPDPYDPRHFYDYRAAFMSGAQPSIDPATGELHWPSQFKLAGHPREFVGGINTRTGLPARPPEMLYSDLEELYAQPMLNRITRSQRQVPLAPVEDLRPPSMRGR